MQARGAVSTDKAGTLVAWIICGRSTKTVTNTSPAAATHGRSQEASDGVKTPPGPVGAPLPPAHPAATFEAPVRTPPWRTRAGRTTEV